MSQQELEYLSQQVALGRSSRRDFLGRAAALGLYLYSMAYLAFLFGAMAVDRIAYRALAG